MSEKEFDLIISLILEMLKAGQVDKVIELLEDAKNSSKADK